MTPPAPGTPVRTAIELCQLWEQLMGRGGFGRQSIWLAFLDGDRRLTPVIVPIDDIPAEPDALFLRHLAHVVADVVDSGRAAAAAVLLSRPGPRAMSDADRRWARALAAELGPLAPWPVHLATCDFVQVFAPDDLMVAP